MKVNKMKARAHLWLKTTLSSNQDVLNESFAHSLAKISRMFQYFQVQGAILRYLAKLGKL
jgi:hypothetical protein